MYSLNTFKRSLLFLFVMIIPTIVHARPSEYADLSQEQLGGIALGESLAQVRAKLGTASSKSKEIVDGAAKCTKQLHYYDDGLEVEICTRGRRAFVNSLRSIKSPKVKMTRGISTGATIDEVRRAYPKASLKGRHTLVLRDPRSRTRVQFLVEAGVVYEINFFREKRAQIEIETTERRLR